MDRRTFLGILRFITVVPAATVGIVRRPSAREAAPSTPLADDQIQAIYRKYLGRDASQDEIKLWAGVSYINS
jgi:hypothetical protein